MKEIKYIVMVITAAFLFAGCQKVQPTVPTISKNVPIEIEKPKDTEVYTFTWKGERFKGSRRDGAALSVKKILKPLFHEIAIYGLNNGYSYAAIVNDNFNNLGGYPINSWEALSKFIDLYGFKHFKPSFEKALAHTSVAKVKVVYLKDRPKGLFVWNLKKLKAETR